MSFRTLQLLVVVAATPFGLAFLLAPELVSSFYGVDDWNSGTLVIARLYGVVLLMVAATAHACMHVEEHALQRRIALASIVTTALGALVSLQSVLTGTTNALMWSTVLLFGFFTAAWLVFWTTVDRAATAHRHA